MTSQADNTITFKSRGVSNTGEVLIGSIEVESVIQILVDNYQERIAELEKEIEADELNIVNNYNLMDESDKRFAELEKTMNDIVEVVLDNRSKQVTEKTLKVIRAAIDKFDLRRDKKEVQSD